MTKIICLLIAVNLLQFSNSDLTDSSLKLLHVFFRHGIRVPDTVEIYPNDPYKDVFKNKFGQITNKGKLETYEIGKILRKRYDSFLGKIFHPNMVLASSTDFDRTKMTALLVLAGLFPPYESDKWSNELNWLPIPVTYKKLDSDYELARLDGYCPVYLQELNKALKSKEALTILEKYNTTLEALSNETGRLHKTFKDVFYLYQLLYIEEHMNLALPNWAIKEYKSIHYLTNMQSYFENCNTILKRLNGGRMLTRVVKNMKEKIANILHPPERKIFLYSGHDHNIINILSALNLFNFSFPKFNAAILIELHQFNNSKQYFVEVYYLEDAFSEPKVQFLKDCGYRCSFEQFLELVFPHLPVNYTKECGSDVYLD